MVAKLPKSQLAVDHKWRIKIWTKGEGYASGTHCGVRLMLMTLCWVHVFVSCYFSRIPTLVCLKQYLFSQHVEFIIYHSFSLPVVLGLQLDDWLDVDGLFKFSSFLL
jgi:hypothetical protein